MAAKRMIEVKTASRTYFTTKEDAREALRQVVQLNIPFFRRNGRELEERICIEMRDELSAALTKARRTKTKIA